MIRATLYLCISLLLTGRAIPTFAQASSETSIVPPLINYSSKLADLNGKPLTGIAGVTFYLYKDAQGGTPLWMETQNVQADENGRYSVMLGSTKSQGLPTDLFASGEARWLSIQVQGQPEQDRILLLSVPYALKAADAQTIGGLPPSAFLLASPPSGGATQTNGANSSTAATTPPPAGAVTGTGTVNYLPLWDSTSDIVTSIIFQSGTGSTAKIGFNTTTPAATLDVKGTETVRGILTLPSTGTATSAGGFNSQPITIASSVFNSGTGTAVAQNFRLLSEPVGNNTSTAGGTLNLQFASGANSFAETGVKIASNGKITFATGQTFPGTGSGTVTNVASGTGLTGGPITSSGTLSIDITKIPQLNAANTFTGNQTVNGSMSATGQVISTVAQGTAPLQVTSTTQVPNLNASYLGGSSISNLATLGGNSFNGNQAVTGNITATGIISAPSIGASSLSSYGNTGSSFTTINSTPAIGVTNYYASGDGIDINVSGSGKIFGIDAVNASSSLGAGVYGAEGVQSNTGTNNSGGAGLWGDAGNHGNEGVLATADTAHAIVAISNSLVGTIYAQNNTTQTQGSSVFEAVGNFGDCVIDVSGNLQCTGSKSAVVPVGAGSRKVALYAVEAAENWFEDAGSSRLSSGSALITLESTFAQTVNTESEYHIFLTPKGDCEGFYVSNETPIGFEVHELRGGHSNVAFDYRIMARRKGYEDIRLADMTKSMPNPPGR